MGGPGRRWARRMFALPEPYLIGVVLKLERPHGAV
jgi:hypothetical protein